MVNYKTFDEVLIHKDFQDYNNAIANLIAISSEENFLRNLFGEGQNKAENEFMDYQNPERMVSRSFGNDRIVPLDTVTIETFKQEHNKDINDRVLIHYGPNSDEYARMNHALAIAIGTSIYFRNGAYKPETEDGRALLAHELTHITQHPKGKIEDSVKNELELEAMQAENMVKNKERQYVTIEAGGHHYKIKRKQMKELANSIADNIQNYIESQKVLLPEPEYLKLLIAYEKWLKERD
jgi:hypothetical protein